MFYHDLIEQLAKTRPDTQTQRDLLEQVYKEKEPRLNVVNKQGNTPLSLAVKHQLIDVAVWLCEKAKAAGLTLGATSNDFPIHSALTTAVAYSDPDIKAEGKSAPPQRIILDKMLTLRKQFYEEGFVYLPTKILTAIFESALNSGNLYFVNRMLDTYLVVQNPTRTPEDGQTYEGRLASIICATCIKTASIEGLKLYLDKRHLWEKNIFEIWDKGHSIRRHYPDEKSYRIPRLPLVPGSQYFACLELLLNDQRFHRFWDWDTADIQHVLESQCMEIPTLTPDKCKALIKKLEVNAAPIHTSHFKYATEKLDLEWLKFLREVSPGINIDAIDSNHRERPLITACRLGKVAHVDFYVSQCNARLDANADKDYQYGRSWRDNVYVWRPHWGSSIPNWWGRSDSETPGSFALRIVAEDGNPDIVKYILQRSSLGDGGLQGSLTRVTEICACDYGLSPLELAVKARKKIKAAEEKSTSASQDPKTLNLDRVIKYLTAVKLVLEYCNKIYTYKIPAPQETDTKPQGFWTRLRSSKSPVEPVETALANIDPADKTDFLKLFPEFRDKFIVWIRLGPQAEAPGEMKAGGSLPSVRVDDENLHTGTGGSDDSDFDFVEEGTSADASAVPDSREDPAPASLASLVSDEVGEGMQKAPSAPSLESKIPSAGVRAEVSARIAVGAPAQVKGNAPALDLHIDTPALDPLYEASSSASAGGDGAFASQQDRKDSEMVDDEKAQLHRASKAGAKSAASSGLDLSVAAGSDDQPGLRISGEDPTYQSGPCEFSPPKPSPAAPASAMGTPGVSLAAVPLVPVVFPAVRETKAPIALTWEESYIKLEEIQSAIAGVNRTIDLTLRLRPSADLKPQFEKLAQLLKAASSMAEQVKQAYQGPMSKMAP